MKALFNLKNLANDLRYLKLANDLNLLVNHVPEDFVNKIVSLKKIEDYDYFNPNNNSLSFDENLIKLLKKFFKLSNKEILAYEPFLAQNQHQLANLFGDFSIKEIKIKTKPKEINSKGGGLFGFV
jgi:hypothetical protein